MDIDGVTRPDVAGVARPFRVDATEEARVPDPTVGADSLETATNTPQFGGHIKYCTLWSNGRSGRLR